ncbi:hypothetical protein EXIGLDRAFT_481801 [Exidia glandulosa HHB12029]|uniref:Aminoglycoside phosphotransferase domain-containing protein n=1 Tax=Exidia glandulosa HHB12029 TaxID=1314781 RepID=A0A165PH91_EXIGL|nr:hypothetical protein EXIGLDRAFT_481801 [Exidia glandulosa HHB12029]
MRPSDHWKTEEEFCTEEHPTSAIWESLPFDAIERLAATQRSGLPGTCKVNRHRYAAGQVWTVLEIEFTDNEVWIVRLRTNHNNKRAPEVDRVARRIESEVATLKLLKERTTVPVPTVFAYSSTADNALGFPYTFMSPVTGLSPDDVGINHWEVVPRELRATVDRYCDSLAGMHLQLSHLRFDSIGSVYIDPSDRDKFIVGPFSGSGLGPYSSAAEFYDASAKALRTQISAIAESAQRQRSALCLWLYERAVNVASSFPNDPARSMLVHTDCHIHNTLVNERGDVVGLMDWDCAAVLPTPLFATQMVTFNDALWAAPDEGRIEHFRLYNAALAQAEQSLPPEQRFVAEMHSSVTCRVLKFLHDWIIHEYDFSDSDNFGIVTEHLIGTSDVQAMLDSPDFQR